MTGAYNIVNGVTGVTWVTSPMDSDLHPSAVEDTHGSQYRMFPGRCAGFARSSTHRFGSARVHTGTVVAQAHPRVWLRRFASIISATRPVVMWHCRCAFRVANCASGSSPLTPESNQASYRTAAWKVQAPQRTNATPKGLPVSADSCCPAGCSERGHPSCEGDVVLL